MNRQPDNNNQNFTDKDNMGFPGEQEQAAAASQNDIDYNHSYDGDKSDGGSGNPQMGLPGTRAGDVGIRDNQNAGTSVSGRGFTTNSDASHPGPGTATDRGYGRVSDSPFGTGVGDTGLSTDSGLDERDINDRNTVGTGDPMGNDAGLADTTAKNRDLTGAGLNGQQDGADLSDMQGSGSHFPK